MMRAKNYGFIRTGRAAQHANNVARGDGIAGYIQCDCGGLVQQYRPKARRSGSALEGVKIQAGLAQQFNSRSARHPAFNAGQRCALIRPNKVKANAIRVAHDTPAISGGCVFMHDQYACRPRFGSGVKLVRPAPVPCHGFVAKATCDGFIWGSFKIRIIYQDHRDFAAHIHASVIVPTSLWGNDAIACKY